MSIPMSSDGTIDITTSALEAARLYSARGWRVVPIKPGEKRPPMGRWQDAASSDLITIESWWTGLYRDHGIGVATGSGSGIFVLDVDVANGKEGMATLATYEERFGRLPATPTVVTPSGGLHYYFALPDGVEIRNDAGKRIGLGIDIRGEGGQVVAPPTRRGPDVYAWLDGTFELEPAQAPDWLLKRVSEMPKTAKLDNFAPPNHTISPDDGPAQRYNARTTWPQLLEEDGWTLVEVAGDGEQRWTRPGKDAREGISATVGHGGGDQLTVFTSSLSWLPEGSYSRFGYHACRHFGGDRSEAARALRAEDYRDVDAFLADLPIVKPEEAVVVDQDGAPLESGWEPLNLAEVLSDDYEPPRPTLLLRDDGEALLYVGRVNALYGESGSGKSWIAMAAAAQVLNRGGHVIYVDLEDHAGSVVRRLQDLGVSKARLLAGLHYVSPLLAWNVAAERTLVGLILEHSIELSVIDSTGEAMALDGAEPNSDDDTARWFRRVPRSLARAGSAVLLLDHVPKAKDAPLGFAIGSQRKRAAIDGASYRVDVVTPPARGEQGVLRLVTAKDRGGYHQQGKPVADVTISDAGLVGVNLEITQPIRVTSNSLTKDIGAALAEAPEGMSVRALASKIGKRKEAITAVLEDLEKSKRVEKRGGGSTNRWHLVQPLDGSDPPVDNSGETSQTATAPHRAPTDPGAVVEVVEGDRAPRPVSIDGARGAGPDAGLGEISEAMPSPSPRGAVAVAVVDPSLIGGTYDPDLPDLF